MLQVVSDIHLEFRTQPPKIPRHAPHLAILGDLGKPFTTAYRDFLQTVSKQFERVFVLMGNHEYYSASKTADKLLAKAHKVCSEFPNVHLLERCRLENKQAVVLTHHAIHPTKHEPGFITALPSFFCPPVVAFTHGHTHFAVDTTYNNIKLVSNPLGYPNEDTGYTEACILLLSPPLTVVADGVVHNQTVNEIMKPLAPT